MVERSGSVTDVAGSFLNHLQDICDINVKVEFLKVAPAGFVMARQRSAQQQAWEQGRVGGVIRHEALSQLLSRELKWGIVRRWRRQAWQKKGLEDTLNHNF